MPVFHGVVTADGALKLDARALFTRYAKSLKNQPVTLTLKKATRVKSRSQLGYWWGVLIPILAEHFGYREHEYDAVHSAILERLRGLKPDPNPLHVRVSMADMTREQVSELIEDCRYWALTDHGVTTPDAGRAEGGD